MIAPRYNSLKTDAISLNSQIVFLKNLVAKQQSQIQTSNIKIEVLLHDSNTQQEVLQVFKELVVKLSFEQLKSIEELITAALGTIFYDKNYSLEIELSDKRNVKCVDLYLVETFDSKTIRSNIQDSVGGGILAVVGVILQLYFISLSDKSHILFVDEGFTQISSLYVDTFLDFIEELCSSRNFIFVLITHDNRFIRDYYTHYKIDDGEALCINKGSTNLSILQSDSEES